MHIRRAELFAFDLPLHRPLPAGGETLHRRRGFVLSLSDGNGRIGCGEIAPLPGWDDLSLAACREELVRLCSLLPGRFVDPARISFTSPFPDLTVPVHPLVMFGLECALSSLLLQAAPEATPLAALPDPLAIPVNGLFIPSLSGAETNAQAAGLKAAGVKTVKVKIGRLPPEVEIDRILALSASLDPETVFRLDGNRNLDFARYQAYFRALAGLAIEYVEEPLADLAAAARLPWPLALDESLRDLPLGDGPAALPPPIRAVVLKPGLLPGFAGMLSFARKAGVKTVFSSSFNTGLAVSWLGLLSVLAAPDTAHGLDTLKYLAADVVEHSPQVKAGSLILPQANFTEPPMINFNRMERIAL